MAKQESLIKFRGKVGDLSFSKHRSRGYEVRMKSGVEKARIMTDPSFQRTRENMSEFGTAAATAKMLRIQLNNLLRTFADGNMRNRLTSLMHKIQKADTDHVRGQRVFLPENSAMLMGFEFNKASSLRNLLWADMPITFHRDFGDVEMVIPKFNPQNEVLLLQGATHIQFTLAAAELSLGDLPTPPVVAQSSFIPLIGMHEEESLTVALAVDENKTVYVVAGIAMYQEVNGQYYSLHNNAYNAMTIVLVDLPQ